MTTIHYVADPMCSWCYGFQPVLDALRERLRDDVRIRLVMGGLAPDSDEPMSAETKAYVRRAWDAVAERCGVTFNHEFWDVCEPRRSTYPACRAVIAVREQGEDLAAPMFAAIQRAYYREARNPSDAATLEACARTLGPDLDAERFSRDLTSPAIERLLQDDLELAGSLGVHGFPTLLLRSGARAKVLSAGYVDLDELLASIGRVEATLLA